jgi:hypothetical protein
VLSFTPRPLYLRAKAFPLLPNMRFGGPKPVSIVRSRDTTPDLPISRHSTGLIKPGTQFQGVSVGNAEVIDFYVDRCIHLALFYIHVTVHRNRFLYH